MKKNISLFLTFLKIGISMHGGGYVLLTIIQKELIEKQKLIDENEYTDIISICQSLPGPLAITATTFIGYKINKFLGAIIALLGVLLPAFTSIILLATLLENFSNNIYVEHILLGIKAAVPILIFVAIMNLIKQFKFKFSNIFIFIISLFALEYLNINSAILIFFAGILGIFTYIIKLRRGNI